MPATKLIELLRALQVGTQEKRIVWEDLPDEDMFRGQVAGAFVRLGKTEKRFQRGYALWLIGPGGAVVAEAEYYPDDDGYEVIEDVYATARLSARGGDQLLAQMIRKLNPEGRVTTPSG